MKKVRIKKLLIQLHKEFNKFAPSSSHCVPDWFGRGGQREFLNKALLKYELIDVKKDHNFWVAFNEATEQSNCDWPKQRKVFDQLVLWFNGHY